MATSDSLFGVVPAISGVTLIRFPTSTSELSLLCWTKQGLSGCSGSLSPRATALYTVPALRRSARWTPLRGRLRLWGTGSPRE